MQPAEFFEKLIDAPGLDDVLYSLSETPLAEEFSRTEHLREADARVRPHYDGLIGEMRDLSPTPAVIGLLELEREFRSFKGYLKRRLLGMDAPVLESQYGAGAWGRLWEGLETELPPEFGRAAERVRLAAAGGAGDPEVLDAALDDAVLRALCEAAEATGNEFVIEYYRRYDTAKGVELLWRARAMGLSEEIQDTYMAERQETELFAGMDILPDEDWPQLVGLWVDGIEPEELVAAGPMKRVRAFVRAADACLMAFARTAKYVPFGPERVFGCAVGLEAESYNFVLVLSGRANDIAPEMLRRLLRTPYV